jgi:hypothetical protein
VIVNLRDNPNEALQGVIWQKRRGWYTLRDVDALTTGQPPQKVDGEIVIHEDRISYFQVVG